MPCGHHSDFRVRISLERNEGRSHNDGLQINIDVSATGLRVAGLNGKILEVGVSDIIE